MIHESPTEKQATKELRNRAGISFGGSGINASKLFKFSAPVYDLT
jgi:hypothetical protein